MAAKIVKASFPGHIITRPPVWRAPFIFASPHSGRDYPARFIADSVLDLADLRRSEDAYVDTLLPSADILGVPVLAARFPRAFVDVNRNAREIDPFMFTTSPVDGTEIRSNRVLAGFGSIPKLAADGRPIYARKLSAAEGRARMTWCYTPYHEALQSLINECKSHFGMAILVDWHSMPAAATVGGRPLPDFILGDRYGSSCAPWVTHEWQELLETNGYGLARNTPYAGGHVTSLYGQPNIDVHAIQIEINRHLYLDEQRVRRLPDQFKLLQSTIQAMSIDVIERHATPSRFAAE
ncbi:MAG: N-formylglutamate amidohydrolase [Pseudomonadota bacterium]